MIYKGNKPLILSLNNGNSKVSRMFKGNQSIYANAVYFPQAIGGTIFRNDEYNIHIFTNTDTFQPLVAGDYEIFLVGPGGAGAGEGPFDFYPGGGGAGGNSFLGGGGASGTGDGGAGQAGYNGGGGSGAFSASGASSYAGGAGGAGTVIVEEYA